MNMDEQNQKPEARDELARTRRARLTATQKETQDIRLSETKAALANWEPNR
jgi:hypothetical protein